jgi:uncharacterized protein YqhQ
MKKCEIGGQAVLEGVMMKAPDRMAIAVRCDDGHIEIKEQAITSVRDRHPVLKWPVLRGIITFGETMVLGIKSLMLSAELFGEEAEEYTPSKFEVFISEKTGKKLEDVMIYFALAFAAFFAVLLFIVLPTFAASFLRSYIHSNVLMNLSEGLIRMLIFIVYIVVVSSLKDIRRVFEYHGAEHKTIHCYEHEEELCVENARKHTTLHPRCGTAFLLIVMVISILIFSFLGWQNIFVRIGTRLLLLPLVAGISYEVIKWAGRSTSPLVNIVMFPGLMLQKLTTREPDDSQLEVAIQSFLAVTGHKEGGKKGAIPNGCDGSTADCTETTAREGEPGSQA